MNSDPFLRFEAFENNLTRINNGCKNSKRISVHVTNPFINQTGGPTIKHHNGRFFGLASRVAAVLGVNFSLVFVYNRSIR